MSEGIAFQALTYKRPRRSASRLWLHAEVARRITQRRKRELEDEIRENHSTMERIFAVGRYAVVVAEERAIGNLD